MATLEHAGAPGDACSARRAGCGGCRVGVGAGDGVEHEKTVAVALTPAAAAAAPARADAACADTLPVLPVTPAHDMPASDTYAVTLVV